jgi:hypothetical protein
MQIKHLQKIIKWSQDNFSLALKFVQIAPEIRKLTFNPNMVKKTGKIKRLKGNSYNE